MENVEIVRAAHQAFERGDVEHALTMADPELVSTRVDPDGSVFHGRAGFVEMLSEWLEEFTDWSSIGDEFVDAGDRVVVRMRQSGRGAVSGAQVEGEYWLVYTVAAGLITRLEIHASKQQALESAGLAAQVELLAAGSAGDEALVEELAGLINGAYAVGEAGLWVEGTTRTTPAEVAAAIRDCDMLVAAREGRIAGCACVRPLDPDTADLGLVSTAPEHWGGGVGRELVRFAEELVRTRGVTTMQLELLVPRGWVHPHKDRIRDWYTRLGYRVVGSAPFEEVATQAASELATPCEFLVFRKPMDVREGRAQSTRE